MDPRADTLLQDSDRIVVFGLAKDLRAFVED
jgi:Trk K+ transport system NAD-binding subunit